MDVVDLNNLERGNDAEVKIVMERVSRLFGDFHPRVKIKGVYFSERRYPFTSYPSKTDRFLVAICLPKHQVDDPFARQAYLAHELVHCLNPNGPPPRATILEEGLAEHSKIYLSREFYQNQFPNFNFLELSSGNYLCAFNKIEKLIGYEGLEGMRDGIRRIRAMTGCPFCQITEDDLTSNFGQTPRIFLKELSQLFRA